MLSQDLTLLYGSLLAEEKGVLREYVTEVMRAEWASGLDIGQDEVLLTVAESIGLDRDELSVAVALQDNLAKLQENKKEADELGVPGVPSFIIGEEKFWGNDRIEFVLEHLNELRLRRI